MAVKSSFINMTLCLLAICLVCSGLLAGVYALTKEPIDVASKAKNEAAIKDVLPEEAVTIEKEDTIEVDKVKYTYNLAYDEKGNTVGCAVNVKAEGFGGPIEIKVGCKIDSQTDTIIIWNTKVLSHAETPGLGAKCTEPKFADQFKNIKPTKLKVVKTPVDTAINAITASTITSKAYVNAVATAVNVVAAVASTPMLIDTATGASCNDASTGASTPATTPTDSTNVILKEGEGSQK